MKPVYDIAVIGGGPAGMAAAAEAAAGGVSVVLFDDQPAVGGQIYRAVATTGPTDDRLLGSDYAAGRPLAERLAQSNADVVTGASVWMVTPEREIAVSCGGTSHKVQATRLILAPGAMERPYAIPGWTLPGVMSVGGAQNLLKASGLAAKDAVLAGSGPLLYLLAAQYVRAGAAPKAVVETTPASNRTAAMNHLGGALLGWPLLLKGLRLMAEVRRAGVPVFRNTDQLRIEGEDRATGLSWQARGKRHTIETDHVFLHLGVIPNTALTMAMGCAHDWDEAQLCWRPRTDPWGMTDLDGVAVAGDGGGIAGAVAAELAGRLAALDALCGLGRLDAAQRDTQAVPIRRKLHREQRARPFLDRLFRPRQSQLVPADPDTLVCRCEEVSAHMIRDAIKLNDVGLNQLKAFTRTGMGACQGRQCMLTASAILSVETGRTMAEIGPPSIRFPIKPVTMAEMAALADDGQNKA